MSSGHRQGGSGVNARTAAPVETVVRIIQRNPGLQEFLRSPMVINRGFLVPYGAGRSEDGVETAIDEQVPRRFRMGVEPDKYVNAHEGIEWWLMTRLGMPYWRDGRGAHWLAEGYEHLLMRLDGWSEEDIAAYEAEWAVYIRSDEAQGLTPENVYPDLYEGPYEPGQDDDPQEDALDSKILPILRAAKTRALAVRIVA